MLKKIIESLTSIDKPILSVMKKGIRIAFIICLFSNILLIIHMLNPISHTLFEIGTTLFKTGLFCFVDFCVCGFIFDKLIKQII